MADDITDLADHFVRQMKPKTGPDAEFEAMRFVYSNLERLDPPARQRVIDHVMGMLKEIEVSRS